MSALTENLITIKDPAELADLGYLAPVTGTLEDTVAYKRWRHELDFWIQALPGLRTPRGEDNLGGTPPRPHQLRHAAIALQRRHNLLAWTMGVGKSSETILLILGWFGRKLFRGLLENGATSLDKALANNTSEAVGLRLLKRSAVGTGSIHIVAPRHTLNQVWMRELERMNLSWAAEVITSESQMHASVAPIWIYDLNDFAKSQSRKGIRMKKEGRGKRLDEDGIAYFHGHPIAKVIAKRYKPSLLVIDECHRIRRGSARTKALRIIRRHSKRVLMLTGTPMDGWVRHAATLLGFGYGENSVAYPFTDEDFSRRFTKTNIVATDIATGKESADRKERPVPGVNHGQIPAFLKATRPLMHRLNLTDPEVGAYVKYPPVRVHKLIITMDEDHAAFYRKVHQEGLIEIREALLSGDRSYKTRSNMLTLLNRLRMASVCPWVLGYEARSTTELIERVKLIVKAHSAEGRKGLIGTTFIQESRYIYDALRASVFDQMLDGEPKTMPLPGIQGIRLYASDPAMAKKTLSADMREDLIEQFMEDEDKRYLIANQELVAEGLNLAETASYLVRCSSGWRANIVEQWRARVERPGQLWDWVDRYTLLNDNTSDIYVDMMLEAKIAATASLIDLDFGEDNALSSSTELDPMELGRLLASRS